MWTRIAGGGAGAPDTRGLKGALVLLFLSPAFFGGLCGPGASDGSGDRHLLGSLSGMGVLAAQDLRYSGSLSYSAGRYFFEETTRSFSFGSTLAVSFGSFELTVNVPILVQNGGLVSLVGGIPVPTGGDQSEVLGRQQSGRNQGSQGGSQGGGSLSVLDPALPALSDVSPPVEASTEVIFSDAYTAKVADPFFQGTLTLHQGFGLVRSLGIRLGVKAPVVGIDSGVGTGEWDFGAGGTVVLGAGSTLFFGDLGYWHYGDLYGLELADGLSYAGGFSRPLLESRASLMITLTGAQALVPSSESPLSAGVGLGYFLENGRMVNLSLAAGLSETSPDLSLSLGWSVGGG